MAYYIERCAAMYMHLICTAVCICMRFITIQNALKHICINVLRWLYPPPSENPKSAFGACVAAQGA